jgi:predicted MFS family arabinose efflux permease
MGFFALMQPELHWSRGFGYDELSIAVAMYGVGCLVAAPAGAVLCSKFMHLNEVIVWALQLPATLLVILIPFVPSVIHIGVIITISGIAQNTLAVCEYTYEYLCYLFY